MKNIREFSEKIKHRIIEINIKRKEKFNNNNNIINSLLNKLLNKLDQVKIFNSTVAILNISILMKF
jgi:hypothetical protein